MHIGRQNKKRPHKRSKKISIITELIKFIKIDGRDVTFLVVSRVQLTSIF